jgi:putative tryptophan/tyrosine transport system substrate-binding protein
VTAPAHFAAVVLLACTCLQPASSRAADRLVVVSSGDSPAYQQALAGMQKLGYPVDTLKAGPDSDAAVVAAIQRAGRDGAIVALGARATALVARAAPTIPVVNCMVTGNDVWGPAGATVVPLEIPVETSIQWLRRLLPNAQNVGILFDPAQNARRAEDGAAALKRAGYAPLLEPVATPSALPTALARLTNTVDVLHAIPDTTVFAPEHSRALLLFSFRNRIPLAGPSEAWVKAGALYAVDWDYADLGRYCGALALRPLASGRAPSPPPLAPARMRVAVNLRAAEQMNIKWDPEILRSVDQVYE